MSPASCSCNPIQNAAAVISFLPGVFDEDMGQSLPPRWMWSSDLNFWSYWQFISLHLSYCDPPASPFASGISPIAPSPSLPQPQNLPWFCRHVAFVSWCRSKPSPSASCELLAVLGGKPQIPLACSEHCSPLLCLPRPQELCFYSHLLTPVPVWECKKYILPYVLYVVACKHIIVTEVSGHCSSTNSKVSNSSGHHCVDFSRVLEQLAPAFAVFQF